MSNITPVTIGGIAASVAAGALTDIPLKTITIAGGILWFTVFYSGKSSTIPYYSSSQAKILGKIITATMSITFIALGVLFSASVGRYAVHPVINTFRSIRWI